MPAKLIWHSDTWPAKPVSGTSDSAMSAMPKIFDARSASASLRMLASTRPVPIDGRGGQRRAPRQDGTGMSSRDA